MNTTAIKTENKLPKVFSDIFFTGLSTVVIKMRILILTPFIIRASGMEAYGAWVQGTNAAMLFSIVAIGGMRDALVRYYHEYRTVERQTELLLHTLLIAFLVTTPIATAIFLLASDFSMVFLHSDEYRLMFQWTSLLLVSTSFYNILLNYIRAQDRIKLYNIIDTVQKWAELVALILALAFSNEVVYLIQASTLTYFVAIMTIFFVISSDIKLNEVWKIRRSTFKKLLHYSMPLVPAQLSIHIADRGDRFLVGYYLGAKAVGIYSICYVIANIISLFSVPLITALPSKLSRMWDAGEPRRVFKIVGTLARWLSVISILTFLIVQSFGVDIIVMFTGFERIEYGRWILFWIGAGVVMFSLARTVNIIQLITKNTKLLGYIWVSANAINLSANIFLIPRFGILGAAIATTIAYFFIFFVSLLLLSKQIKEFFPYSFYLKLLFSSLLLWFSINIITVTTWYGILITAATGSLIFIVSFLMLRPFTTEDERNFLERLPVPFSFFFLNKT